MSKFHYIMSTLRTYFNPRHRISVSIIVAFVSRALSNLPDNMFCYGAISSAGVVVILPGFTVREWYVIQWADRQLIPRFPRLLVTSALELMSKNIFCGSVRIVYAIIYTLFLVNIPQVSSLTSDLFLSMTKGFGLTIGSDFYLVLDKRARQMYYRSSISDNLSYTHGRFVMLNGSDPLVPISGVIGLGRLVGNAGDADTIKGR